MIMPLNLLIKDLVQEEKAQVKAIRNPVSLSSVRFEPFEEGKGAQHLRIGKP